MKLDRNTNEDGKGKYSLLLNRRVSEIRDSGNEIEKTELEQALFYLENLGVLDHGNDPEHPEKNFFVLRYGDRLADWAIHQYGSNALHVARAHARAADAEKDPAKAKELRDTAASLEEYALDVHAEHRRITTGDFPRKLPTE